MKATRRSTQKGFTLVELLAVVLVLAVLAAIAIPSYLNTRKSSAARTCKANIAAIASAEAAYAVRFGAYVADASGTTTGTTAGAWESAYTSGTSGSNPGGGLVGAPEGLQSAPLCPLDNTSHYQVYTTTGGVMIACPNAGAHNKATGADPTNWQRIIAASGVDTTNGNL